ncbi:hypothetical protein D3C72_1698000 [compost metagenome]
MLQFHRFAVDRFQPGDAIACRHRILAIERLAHAHQYGRGCRLLARQLLAQGIDARCARAIDVEPGNAFGRAL